jgi:hypothetical protein
LKPHLQTTIWTLLRAGHPARAGGHLPVRAPPRLHRGPAAPARNAMAIYQDLVDQHGFAGAYNSVKRFCASCATSEPEQFDRLSFLPGEEMQVDYGEGAPTRVPGSDRYRKPRLFVATLRYSRRSFRRVVWKSSQQIWAEAARAGLAPLRRLPAATWCWTTSRKACSSPTCTSPNSTRCTPPPWRTTAWWPTRRGCATPTARARWRTPSATPRPRP